MQHGTMWPLGSPGKTTPLKFSNSTLLLPILRQDNAGSQFGSAGLVASFDAGANFVDYGRWQGYTVTASSCTSTTATLTLSSTTSLAGETLVNGNQVYVHDVGSVYNGQRTITVSGSTISYTAGSCSGAGTPSSGYVALLAADGSAPIGPCLPSTHCTANPGYNIQFPTGIGLLYFIQYGQDGNYPMGIEPLCDPTQWVCFLAGDYSAAGSPIRMGRFPVTDPGVNFGAFTLSSWEFYTCPGYSPYFPVEATVCDANLPANRTTTLASATPILYVETPNANFSIWPGQPQSVTYMPEYNSYLILQVTRDQSSQVQYFMAVGHRILGGRSTRSAIPPASKTA